MPSQDDVVADESVDAITDSASRLLVAIAAQSIANVDEMLTILQFRTLVIVSTRGPVSLATLPGLLDVTPSTTDRMADRLVAAGLIDRQPHPDSRRELVVELTPRGLDVVAAVTGAAESPRWYSMWQRASAKACSERRPPSPPPVGNLQWRLRSTDSLRDNAIRKCT